VFFADRLTVATDGGSRGRVTAGNAWRSAIIASANPAYADAARAATGGGALSLPPSWCRWSPLDRAAVGARNT
jgi:hypothetical protein